MGSYGTLIKNIEKDDTSFVREIKIDRFISEDKIAIDTILNSIKNNKKILITGGLGVGKTHFIRVDLLRFARELEKKVVIVIPGVCQLENLNTNKGLSVVHGGISYFDTDIVGVTPDSLLTKVLCHIKPSEFILVIDEAHQKVLDNNFRRAFKNIDIAEKNAYKTVYITATPRTLDYKTFDQVIEITTKSPIKNKIEILRLNGKSTDDDKLEIYRKVALNYENIVIFQNDKKLNKLMSESLAEGHNVTKTKYKSDFQYSFFKECNNDSITTEEWEWITRTEYVQSGKANEETKIGLITANITFVTSAILAGIDLRLPRGNKGLLIIDGTERIDPDSFIQLIGRFRDGIEVLILTKERDEKYEYESFEEILDKILENNTQIANCVNNSKFNIKYLDGAIKDNILEFENGIWKVDVVKSIAKAYEIWCNLILYNLPRLAEELKSQRAFEIISLKQFSKTSLTENMEIKLLKKVAKKEFEMVRDMVMAFNDNDLKSAINKIYEQLNQKQQEIVKKYYELRPESHLEKLKMTGSLHTDADGVVDIIKAFKEFYSKKWSTIQHELDIKEACAINRDIKVNGAEKYLQIGLYRTRNSKDIQYAKIRYELFDIEQKRGRVTNKLIQMLTEKMINEGYFRNSHTKVYFDLDSKIQDKQNAFNELKDIVKTMIRLIYNFKDNSIISSVRY